MIFHSLVLLVSLFSLSVEAIKEVLSENLTENPQPNIIIILADDLGWNDVGYHGSNEIPTPNIDALSYNGVIFQNHYSEALCSPSRAALLSGKYPIHNGMQHGVILEPEPWGLPLTEKLLPEYLNELGYVSHAIGKWHLGFYKQDYTPIQRGFKSHYGFWNGYQDYYNHTVQASFTPYEGYDMRRDDKVDLGGVGNYSTDLFTDECIEIISNHNKSKPLFLYLAHLAPHAGNYEDPLQAPDEIVENLSYISDSERQKYAGMVVKLDESVGKIIKALRVQNMLQNSIILMISDNGAPTKGLHPNRGSNWPLKGEKITPWEGGIRTVASMWSPLINGQRVFKALIHISDWLPTLYTAAGGNVKELGNIDGINQWQVLTEEIQAVRRMILHNIDDVTGYAAIRIGDFKYVNGTVMLGFLDKWSGNPDAKLKKRYNTTLILNSDVSNSLLQIGHILPTYEKIISLRKQSTVNCGTRKFVPCYPFEKPCLFDVRKDPCEIENIYRKVRPNYIQMFENQINKFRTTAMRPGNKRTDKNADPKLYNNVWVNWGDYTPEIVKI